MIAKNYPQTVIAVCTHIKCMIYLILYCLLLFICWILTWIPIINNSLLLKKIISIDWQILLKIFDVRVNIYENKLNERNQYIYISNHLSALDGMVIWRYFPYLPIASDIEHHRIPIIGRIFKIMSIGEIDRSNSPQKMISSIRLMNKAISKGKSFLIFPQGTTENKIYDFKKGAFSIAKMTKTPICLMYLNFIDHNIFYYGPPWDLITYFKKLYQVKNKRVEVSILSTINPEDFDNTESIRQFALTMYQTHEKNVRTYAGESV
jgi:1-acyl-sn-glycerol-3-phosphate acyltransferase